ncbi:hypothetical protein FB45DRAFT_862295 [Roridomyces roridus]|uniref:C2H2-type domain-containing protein n=1 Tax=Roridomyces roridus TaxID=1738132 RepID=A0AAD7FW84_9AGAR|nr:hypothetical protein FB45DRAFT_862295 [Roridomyces roridus]
MSMPPSTSIPDTVSSPGGSQLPDIQDVYDRNDRSLILGFPWSEASSATDLDDPFLCQGHGPKDVCDCSVRRAPEDVSNEYDSDSESDDFDAANDPETPVRSRATRAFGSADSDVLDFHRGSVDVFERPSANPQVSPVQLPPLCGDLGEDSEDELEDDEKGEAVGPSQDELDAAELMLTLKDYFGDSQPISSESSSVVAVPVIPSVPSEAAGSAPRKTKGKNKALQPLSSNDVAKRVVTRSAGKKRLHSACVAEEATEVEERKLWFEDPVNQDLCVASSSLKDSNSYANAPHSVRAVVRLLAAELNVAPCPDGEHHPSLSLDLLTPDVVYPFICPFPSCDVLIAPVRRVSEAHFKDAHWETDVDKPTLVDGNTKMSCPVVECNTSTQMKTMGRHLLNKHSTGQHADKQAEPALFRCKICRDSEKAEFCGLAAYEAHVRVCADAVDLVLLGRGPVKAKKQRVN